LIQKCKSTIKGDKVCH